jgi:hypothetical protein
MLLGPPADMRPGSGSPVLGKGLALPFATSNYEGVPWAGAPNIGAY